MDSASDRDDGALAKLSGEDHIDRTTLKLGVWGLGSGVAALVIYLGASVYLITYEDTFDGSKGPLWSFGSMTRDQQIAYAIAAYAVPGLLALAAGLCVLALARGLLMTRRRR